MSASGRARGRRIDVAMFDAMIAMQPLVVTRLLATGVAPRRVGNRHALSAPFGVYARARRQLRARRAQRQAVQGARRDDRQAGARRRSALRLRPAAADQRDGAARRDRGLVAAPRRRRCGRRADRGRRARRRGRRHGAGARVAAGRGAAAVATRSTHPTLGPILAPEQPAHFVGVPRGGARPAPRLGEHTRAALDDPRQAWKDQR